MHSSTEKSKTTQVTNENIKNNTDSVVDEINPSTPLLAPARPSDTQDLHAFFSFTSVLIYLLSSSRNPYTKDFPTLHSCSFSVPNYSPRGYQEAHLMVLQFPRVHSCKDGLLMVRIGPRGLLKLPFR